MKRNKITTSFEIVLEAESMQCHPAFLTLEASLHVLLPEQVALLAVLSDCLALVVELCGDDPMIGPINLTSFSRLPVKGMASMWA